MKMPSLSSSFRPALVLLIALAALPFVRSEASAQIGSCGFFCDFQCASTAERAITCAQNGGGTCGIGSSCQSGGFGGPCGLGATLVICHGSADQ